MQNRLEIVRGKGCGLGEIGEEGQKATKQIKTNKKYPLKLNLHYIHGELIHTVTQ